MTRRLPLLTLTDLSESQRGLYDAITGEWHWNRPNSDNGELDGPYNAWLYAPEVGRLCSSFALGLRDAINLSDRVRELAILIVASHPFSPFTWHAHVGRAQALGITDDQIERIRLEELPKMTDPIEVVVVESVRAIVTD